MAYTDQRAVVARAVKGLMVMQPQDTTRVGTDVAAEPAPSAAPSSGPEPLVTEWTECRVTIGRFDAIVVDLRKFGFSLVTTLLGASAFISFSNASSVSNPLRNAATAAFILIMFLITVVFTMDVYYTSLLNGAVERALDLEAAVLSFRITKYLSDNAKRVRTVTVTLVIYLALQAAALGLALWFELSFPSWGIWAVAVFGVAALAFMVLYWNYANYHKHWQRDKPRTWNVPSPLTDQIGRMYNTRGSELPRPSDYEHPTSG